MNFKYLKLENIEDVLIPLTGTNQKNASLCRGAYIDEKKEFYENSGEILRGLIEEEKEKILAGEQTSKEAETYKKMMNSFYDEHLEVLNDLLMKKVSEYSFLELWKNGNIRKVIGEKNGSGSYVIRPKMNDKRIAAELIAIGDSAAEDIEQHEDYAALALKAYALSGNLFVTKNTAKKFLGTIQDDRTVGEEVMGLVRLEKNGRRHCEKKIDRIKEVLGEETFYKSIIKIGKDPLTLALTYAARNWSD